MIKFATLRSNRHKAAGVFSLMLAACLLLLLPGCQGPLGTQDAARTGDLSLTIEGPPRARTILPGDPMGDFDRLVFVFDRIGVGEGFPTEPKDGGLGTLLDEYGRISFTGVPVGSWNLTVRAYLYIEAEDPEDDGEWELTATGSAPLTMAAAGPNTASVTLNPEDYGYGRFAWDVTFPAGVTGLNVEVFEWPSLNPLAPPRSYGFDADDEYDWIVSAEGDSIGVESYIELAAGTYWAVFTLTDGRHTLPVGSILRVYRNMISLFEGELEFDPATDLELAMQAIRAHTWAAVSQPWIVPSGAYAAYVFAAALGQVQAEASALVAAFDVEADVTWTPPITPTLTEAGRSVAPNTFTVVVTCEETEDYGTHDFTVNVTFLQSNANQAYAAIVGRTSPPQIGQPMLDTVSATVDAALAEVQALVDSALASVPATAVVAWVTPPIPDIDEGLAPAEYYFTVVITGTDTTTRTTLITETIEFLNLEALMAQLSVLIGQATTLIDNTIGSAENGNDVSMTVYWAAPALLATLTTRRTEAQAALDTPTAAALIAAFTNIQNAYLALTTGPYARRLGRLERYNLESAVAAALLRGPAAEYTEATWTPFAEYLTAAQGVLANPAATQAALTGAYTNLTTAYGNLECRVPSARAALWVVLEPVQGHSQANFAPAQWAAFAEARTAATTAYGNEGITAVELDAARTSLTTMVAALVYLGPARAALQPVLTAANQRVQANYTLATWGPFYTARVNAQAAMTTAMPVADIDARHTALSNAMAGLHPAARDSFVINWTGFSNPLLAEGVTVTVRPAGADTIVVAGLPAAVLTGIRWYEGLAPIDIGATLEIGRMPTIVTIRATIDGRTYSINVDTVAGIDF